MEESTLGVEQREGKERKRFAKEKNLIHKLEIHQMIIYALWLVAVKDENDQKIIDRLFEKWLIRGLVL